jgi:murein DD-endopeptidase MepM/ murein hydrolase activator NlpD
MNIILVSNRLAKTRSIALGGGQIALVLILLSVLMIGAAFALQYALVRFAPESLSDEIRTMLSQVQNDEQHKQQVYLQNSLDAMAIRVGQMQAQVQRLDALGARLTKLAGMKPTEFQFSEPPAMGGPMVPSAEKKISENGLNEQLDRLGRVVNDRSDKLTALETMMMQNQLSRRLLPSMPPVRTGYYSSNFGWRIDPFTGQMAMHEGVDFVANAGTPIYASAGGVVDYAGLDSSYGNMVEIDHGNNIVTRYAHASKVLVKVGQVVRRGQEIAEVGTTGRSTGNHLHFEVRYKGVAQNPVRFLQKSEKSSG